MSDAMALPLTTPPAFLLQDRRRTDRRRGPRRVESADVGADRRERSDRRADDRRSAPDEQLYKALEMLDGLSRKASPTDETQQVIAGAAQRMWMALAEFRRESGEHTLDAWLAERKAG